LIAGITRLGDFPKDPENKGDYQDKADDAYPHARFENASYYPATGQAHCQQQQPKDSIDCVTSHGATSLVLF
jgi:hypothetical protein